MQTVIRSVQRLLFDTETRRFLWLLLLAGLAVRCLTIVVLFDPDHIQMYEHGMIARNLYHGHGFTMHWPYHPVDPERAALMAQPPQYEGAWQPPATPYLIWWSFLLFGDTPAAAVALTLLNALFSAAIAPVVVLIARLFAQEKEARISGLVAMLFLPAIVGVVTFSGSSLYQFMLVLTLYGFLAAVIGRAPRALLWTGACCGVLTLLRSEFLVMSGILFAAVVLYTVVAHRTRAFVAWSAGGLVLFCAVIMPWMLRNYALFGKVVPIISRSSHELWRGNNEFSTGGPYTADGREIWLKKDMFPELVHTMDSLPYNQHLEIAMDSVFRSRFLHFVAEHPDRTAVLSLKKLLYLWTFDPHYPPARHPLFIVSMLAVGVLFWIGLVAWLRRAGTISRRDVLVIYIPYLLYYTATFVATFVLPRYQVYFFTALLPFTGIGWLWCVRRLRHLRSGSAI